MSLKKKSVHREVQPKAELNPAVIQIQLNEIGNIEQFGEGSTYDGQYFYLTAEFDGNPITTPTYNIFDMCRCSTNDNIIATWEIQFPTISDEEIYKLSTCPLIIKLQTFPMLEDEEEKTLPSNTDDIKTVGFFPIYLSNMLSTKYVNLKGTQPIALAHQSSYIEMMTWPNTPYICYDIKSLNPLLKAPTSENPPDDCISEPIIDIPFINLSLTFECIINMKKDFLENFTYDMAINFPLENSTKTINLPNGKVCSVNKMDYHKLYTNLINFPGNLKFSTIPTNLSFDINNFEIPDENCKLDENSILSSDKIISFQQFIKLKITKDMHDRFLNKQHITIEVLLTPQIDNSSSNIEHFIGIIDLSKFKLVGIQNLRYIVPLMKFKSEIFNLYPSNEQIFHPKQSGGVVPAKSSQKGKGKKPVEIPSIVPEFEYIFNDKNFSTCVIINIEVDKAYLPRIKQMFMGNECRVLELLPKFDEDLIDLNVKKTINDFIDDCDCNCKPNDETMECKEYETKIYSMFNKVTMNYSWNMDSKDRANDLLENIYIFLSNKIHESFNDGIPDLMSNPKYRLKCAIECLELGFNDEAQDLYIMNIYNTNEQADYYIDYAIHNLFICDMAMAKVCCDEAIKSNPKTYAAYLILAYIKFFTKDYVTAENILLRLTTMCNNFAEAWMALLALYLSDDRKSEIDTVLRQLHKFIPTENNKTEKKYLCHLHNRKELLWNQDSIDNLTDPKLIAIRYFIQWGCLQFAEISLGFIIHRYSFDSYEYLYHMALVDYYRKDYSSALQRCTAIRGSNSNIILDKKTLIIQCLLEMHSLNAIYELKRIKNNSKHEKLINNYLIYMKIGRMYMNMKKYRTAIYYWKQCCYNEGTYCGFKLLGLATLKCQQLNLSEICFQMAYKIDPFNYISWGNLALINFRKKHIEQFKIYAENAKKQPMLDNKLSEIIEKIYEILEKQLDRQTLDL